jgi:cathepsin F/cysteine peptidase B
MAREKRSQNVNLTLLHDAALPTSVDWTTKGAVTPVKDQGQCGCCWAFSTTGALEGAGALAAGAPATPLSEQLLVSCDATNQGCGGGFPNVAVTWLVANRSGVPVTEASYPYASGGGGSAPACVPGGHAAAPVNATGWWAVAPQSGSGGGSRGGGSQEDALAAWAAAYGPVSVLVDAMTQLWWPYVGGVISDCCDTDIDHAVLVVGFNSSSSASNRGEAGAGVSAAPGVAGAGASHNRSSAEDSPSPAGVSNSSWWTIKNSWAASWGEGGYVRLARGAGECGINATGNSIVPSVAGGRLPPYPATACPADAAPFNVTDAGTGAVTASGCVWVNGTSSAWTIFPSPGAYCDYMAAGYIGYTGSGSLDAAAYPCPPSLYASGDGGGALFCVLAPGQRGFHGWPPTATAYCDELSAGRFGYTWAV